MKKHLLLLITILLVNIGGFAQKIDYDDYDRMSNWFVGLDLGYLWHTSDVQNVKDRFPVGASINLGYSFNQFYGSQFSYDLRFRILAGNWYGKDTDTTAAIANNYAVSQYYDTLGYTVQNFKAKQIDLSLELAVHYNRWRERFGIDPYIFGGIGVTYTQTLGDMFANPIQGGGQIYDYATTPDGSIIKDYYTVGLDKNEEGDFYDRDVKSPRLMPSLGIGIGYYFTPRFSIGLEHRSTFFMGDYFDGTIVNQDGQASKPFKNDIYHYTGFYLKWYFKKHVVRDEVRPPVQDPLPEPTIPPVQEQPDPQSEETPSRGPSNDSGRKQPPIVNFTNPSVSPTSVTTQAITILAHVQYVDRSSDLRFTQNGQDVTSFIFKPYEGAFSSAVTLLPGENIFKLIGVNKDGSDYDETVVIFNQDRIPNTQQPPVVNIVSPSQSPFTLNQNNYIIKADIRYVTSRNNLTVTLNGQAFTNYSFTPEGSINFTANATLQTGINEFVIKGVNNAGSDSDKTVLIYGRESTEQSNPPEVKITKPYNLPYSTTQKTESIEATVKYVNNKSQVIVEVNGVRTNNFVYNNTQQKVNFLASLNPGSNIVRVIATNAYGAADDDAELIYKQKSPQLPPYVKIITPEENPYKAPKATQKVVALVQNVSQKSQIEVKVNGEIISDFDFNPTTNLLEFSTPLNVGMNSVRIQGSNAVGVDSDNVNITFEKAVAPLLAPSVGYINPSYPGLKVGVASFEFLAEVKNVSKKSEIEFRVNGRVITDFEFIATEGLVKYRASLKSGENTSSIRVTTAGGTAQAETRIIYRQLVEGTVITAGLPNKDRDKGVVIDLNVPNEEICIITRERMFTKQDLLDPNFYYIGTANSIFFKAMGNGIVTVREEPFPLSAGVYYGFSGYYNIKIELKYENNDLVISIVAPESPYYAELTGDMIMNPCMSVPKTLDKPVRNIEGKIQAPTQKENPVIKGVPERRTPSRDVETPASKGQGTIQTKPVEQSAPTRTTPTRQIGKD